MSNQAVNSDATWVDLLCAKLEALRTASYPKPASADTLKLVDKFNENLAKAKMSGFEKLREIQPLRLDFCEDGPEIRERRINNLQRFLRQEQFGGVK